MWLSAIIDMEVEPNVVLHGVLRQFRARMKRVLPERYAYTFVLIYMCVCMCAYMCACYLKMHAQLKGMCILTAHAGA